jgi:acetyl-CoA carboxylase carboxyltransferase component
MIMEWFKKHVDTVIILGAFGASLLWMNGKFNDVEKDIGSLKTEIAVMKAVLIMKNIMPPEICKNKEVK